MGVGSDLRGATFGLQREASSTVCSTKACGFAQKPRKETGTARSSTGSRGKGCSSQVSDDRTGLFRTFICGTEKERRLAPGYRLECSKPFSGCSEVQDGDSPVNSVTVATGGICSDIGSSRCIFPPTHQAEFSEVSKILHNGNNFQVCSPLFRAGHCSKSFHKSHESSSQVCPRIRHAPTCISGRLAIEKSMSKSSDETAGKAVKFARKVGYSSKFRKVKTNPYADFRFSEGKIRLNKGSSVSNRRVHEETLHMDRVLQRGDGSTSKSTTLLPRPAKSLSRSGTIGKAQRKTNSMVSEMFLQTSCGRSVQESATEKEVLPLSPILGESEEFTCRKSSPPAICRKVRFYGCKSDGLGSSDEQQFISRTVDSAGSRAALQCQRINGYDRGSASFQSFSERQSSDDGFRQHHGSSSCTETRRDSLLDSVQEDHSSIPTSRQLASDTTSKMDARQRPDRSRLIEQNESGHGSRMVSAGSGVPEAIFTFSGSQNRYVCDICKQKTSCIHQPLSRPKSSGSGCFFNILGRLDGLCLSSDKANSASITEDSDRQLLHSSDSTSMAGTSMVSHSPEYAGRFSEKVAESSEIVVPESRESISLKPSGPISSRLAIVKRSFQEKGFSESVSERATLANRESTRSLYDSRFSKFTEWCESVQRSLGEITISEIADYLMYLFNQGIAVNTITGYRSAISSAMGLYDGFTVGAHPVISKLIKGFKIQRPVTRKYFPNWDLNVVLKALMKAPFEPPLFDSVQEKKFTTWKTAFLVSLANAKRASETHAISRSKRDLIFNSKGVQLRAIAGFMAKTQSALCDSKPYFIADHKAFVGTDMIERVLCPKRILKYYLKFTGGFKEQSRLFLKCTGEGEVSKNTVSSWLKSTILYAYEHSNEELEGQVSGHDVRRMATSCAFAAGVKLSDILQAAEWKSSSTFTTHYLKDVQLQPDGQYRLGAVVASSRLALI